MDTWSPRSMDDDVDDVKVSGDSLQHDVKVSGDSLQHVLENSSHEQ